VVLRSNARPHKSTREHVADLMRNAILAGELLPGERLIEAELAHTTGTSRAPVREALRQLEQEGLVVSSPYRETRVATTTEVEVQEVLVPIRTVLKLFALRHVMTEGAAETVQALARIVEQMHAAAAAGDRYRLVELDMALHRTLVQAAQHTHPIRLWSSITAQIRGTFLAGIPHKDLTQMAGGHERLLDIIRAGDPERAATALQEHIADWIG